MVTLLDPLDGRRQRIRAGDFVKNLCAASLWVASALNPEQPSESPKLTLPPAVDKLHQALAGDTPSRFAVTRMFQDGRLDAASPDGAKLLASLTAIATGPIAKVIDRRQVLGNVVRALVHPSPVIRAGESTLTASAERLLAAQDPVEFARVMAALSAPAGKVTLRGGTSLERPADWNAAAGRDGREMGDPALMKRHEIRGTLSRCRC